MTNPSRDIVKLAEGVHIIDDVLNQVGVDTVEGRIGPLMFGKAIRTHYIDMPAHSFVDEHPHPDESLTYTVRGRWVMCANGRRRLIKPGSLYWFGPEIPTGYEVPFDEPAFLLVFKGGVSESPEEMIERVETKLKPTLAQMQAQGQVFMLRDLPPDHPARAFAHKVNPEAY